MMQKKHPNKNNSILLTILFLLLLTATACGSRDAKPDTSAASDANPAAAAQYEEDSEEVYVSRYQKLELTDTAFRTVKLVGDFLYYQDSVQEEDVETPSGIFRRYSLQKNNTETLPLRLEQSTILNFAIAQEEIYAVILAWTSDTSKYENYLVKYDASGAESYRTVLTDIMAKEKITFFYDMLTDSQGRVYLTTAEQVLLFDSKGSFRGAIAPGGSAGSQITSIGADKKGQVYIGQIGNGAYTLTALDFDQKAEGVSYQNVPGGSGNCLNAGLEKDFFLYDSTGVYEYDLAGNTAKRLFQWFDVDIDSLLVQSVGALSDGTLLALIHNFDTNEYGFARLTKGTAQDAPPQKTKIIVYSIYGNPNLQQAATNFNRQSDKYQVKIEKYYKNNLSLEEMRDRISADLISDNCPDLLELDLLRDFESAAKNGFLTDLVPYLEKSGVLNRDSFVENVLENCTYDEKLITLPRFFILHTVAGYASEFGTIQGWTLDEMMSCMEKYPQRQFFTVPFAALHYGLCCEPDLFVDWEAGTCNYNSPAFIRFLEFTKRYNNPAAKVDDDRYMTFLEDSTGKNSLYDASIGGFDAEQFVQAMYGAEISLIGYPTKDGSPRCLMELTETFGIPAKAANKDGAWEFLEYFVSMERSRYESSNGLPSVKSMFEADFEASVNAEYLTTMNGELILDDNGQPMLASQKTVTIGDFSYTYRAITPEEAQHLRDLISCAKDVFVWNGSDKNSQLLQIIQEETEYYYNGAKTAEETAEIIQNRIQLYLNENR